MFVPGKYQPYQYPVQLDDRTWPSRTITQAPSWCSVDLRDGNQALPKPMDFDRKKILWESLIDIGFKEIEVGFPAASTTDFEFTRFAVENLPENVTPQVLTQARDNLIQKTFQALEGAPRAIVHMYNSTSEIQRNVVFRMDRSEIIALMTRGLKLVKECSQQSNTDITLEYSPESFTGTEHDFAVEICQAAIHTWDASPTNKIIINLPATVELCMPNQYADRIEKFLRDLGIDRNKVILSVHTHNDRGTGIAATEMALLAGADRVEGTLFGNGERTGNADLVTLAMNMYSQGIDPGLNFSNMPGIIAAYEESTGLSVIPRQPYAGEFAHVAFSGSHQDAIGKAIAQQQPEQPWRNPYLPTDPTDYNMTYRPIVINSQSGKGGAAFVMAGMGFDMPKEMHPEFGKAVQALAERKGGALAEGEVREVFEREYLEASLPYSINSIIRHSADTNSGITDLSLEISIDGEETTIGGSGNGLLNAVASALKNYSGYEFRLTHFHEDSLGDDSSANAVAYVEVTYEDQGTASKIWGAAIDTDSSLATIKALFSAFNRMIAAKEKQSVESPVESGVEASAQ